ncbi:MAG: ribonuclease P protein subunit [Candidatus Woesearchaeota archaeon]
MTDAIKMPLLMKQGVFTEKKTKTTIKGKIIDETKNTITIITAQGKKRITKNNHTITIMDDNRSITIDGRKMMRRPEDRIMIKKA